MTHQLMKTVLMILAGAALLFGAVLGQAQTYDFVADFSSVSNPNGVWSYGWEPNRGGLFSLMNIPWTDYTWGTQQGWAGPNDAANPPTVAYAVTDINHPTVFVPAGTVNTHPGPGGENAVVRCTAPESGTYRLEGWFIGNDYGWAGETPTTDVAVLRGPFEVFTSFVESYNVLRPFSATMPLLAGETVDVTIGFGRNGSYWHDSTGVSATFTKVSDAACAQPPAGLISWWTGEHTARDAVDGNDGTLQGDATFGPGLVGNAFNLDGAGDFVAVPDSPSLDFGTNDLTVAFWVKFDTVDGEHIMVEKYVESYPTGWVPRQGWTFTKMENQQVRLHLADNASSDYNVLDVTPPQPIPANTWIFVAAKRAGETFTIYWNGVALGSATFTAPLDLSSASSLKFGHRGTPQDTPGSQDTRVFDLHGSMDEVQIFGRALSDDEIRYIYLAAGAGQCRVKNVAIDIRPGSFPNSVNPGNNGVIPVAILTSDSFSAATVDPATVRFGATGNEAPAVQSALEDVDGDGDLDRILHFRTQQTGIKCGTTSGILTGRATGGQLIAGTDSMVTVGCK